MAFVPIPQTVRAVLRFQQFTDERQSVLHYKKSSGSITQADLDAIATNLRDWWAGPGRTASNTQLALFEVTATDISVEGGAQSTLPVSPPITGSVASASAPGNVTGTASWRTNRTGRSFRGRTYWPGFYDGGINDDGTINASLVTAVAVAAANLLFGFVPVGFLLAVASQVLHTSEPIMRVVVENVVDSQRRRLPKRGI